MLPNALRRLGHAALVVLLVTFGVSLLLTLAPGSVAETVLGENATPENIAALIRSLGFDRPFLVQYLDWLAHAVRGDLGSSPITRIPVTDAILQRLPVTVEIAVLALAMSLAVAVPLAVVCASRPGGVVDRTINAVTSMLLSVPAFVARPVLVYFLAVHFKVFPALGWVPLSDGLGRNLAAAFLPAVAAGLVEIASFHRVLRADLIGTLREDFVAAARAKGLSRPYVMFRHAFRPSSYSLLTVSGPSLARLIGGTIIVETLFVIPGLGQLIATAVVQRDVVTVQGVVAFIAVTFVVVNMLVDLGYGLLDPRLRRPARARSGRRATRTAASAAATGRVTGPPRQPPAFGRFELLLGTDGVGRSLLSRVIYGAQISLVVGTAAAAAAGGVVIGIGLGLVAGYFRKTADEVITLLADAVLSFPVLVLLSAVTAIFSPSIWTILVRLAVASAPTFIRLTRANTMAWASRDFVRAARNMGAGHRRILFREILPNVLPSITSYLPLVIAALIVAEVSLSFLGLGIPPPTPSWGGMISAGAGELRRTPYMVFVPAAVLFLTVFALNQAGEHLRLRFDRTLKD